MELYGKCNFATKIIDNAISEMVKRLLLVMNQIYFPLKFEQIKQNKQKIPIILGGSLLQKSQTFRNCLKNKLGSNFFFFFFHIFVLACVCVGVCVFLGSFVLDSVVSK